MAEAPRRSYMPALILILVTLASTGALYFWAKYTIAIPGCEAAAQQEHLRFVRYVPVGFDKASRNHPDGLCEFVNAEGKPVERSLSRYLTGIRNITSIALRFDIVVIVLFFVWGFVFGTIFRRRKPATPAT